MTYCVGIMLDTGLIFASDSRTHAEVDNFARFCKMTVFERAADRVIVLLSSGNLAGTQAVISVLKQRGIAKDGVPNLGGPRGRIFTFDLQFSAAAGAAGTLCLSDRTSPSISP